MTSIIIFAVAVLGILLAFGAALTFAWLCGMAAGRVVGWVLRVEDPTLATQADELLSPAHIAEIDTLVADSQRMLRESRQRAALTRA